MLMVRLGSSSVDGVLGRLHEAGHDRPLAALAQAIASSPPARTMPGVVLAVQGRPSPLLMFVGHVDAAARARIGELGGLLEEAATRLRVLAWADVETACQRLAERIRGSLGSDALQRACLVGVPRGGVIVAGLLAYALDIPRERVGRTEGAETVILVDDCSISGVRLHEVLAEFDASQRLVIATLLSHPELRAAVVSAEPQVAGFMSGGDLLEHTERILGPESEAWRRRWKERVPTRYHTALLDLPVFPWGEPQVRLFNPVTQQTEPSWWLAPPSSCLHHRVSPSGLQIQEVDADPARTRLAAEVVPVAFDGATVLVDTGRGRTLRLTGTAAALWDAWIGAGSLERAAAAVSQRYEIEPERAVSDLKELLRGLAERELLAQPAEP